MISAKLLQTPDACWLAFCFTGGVIGGIVDQQNELMDKMREIIALFDMIEDMGESLGISLHRGGPAAKKLAIAKLRPTLEPIVESRSGVKWDDALPAIELIDTIEELEEAVENPVSPCFSRLTHATLPTKDK